ncbi:MAG: HU family DNA-binding protein [Candidatus Eisenbacteria sp.]|nr:HU family DNA-binding protein [Candidatus Eisenbacteria bacterium]
MTRDQMVEGVMRSAGISKANVNRFYDGLVTLARKQLEREGEFVLPGLGVLRVRRTKARDARNPRTGEKIRVPAKKVVRFRAYKELKDLMNPELAKKPAGEEPQSELSI